MDHWHGIRYREHSDCSRAGSPWMGIVRSRVHSSAACRFGVCLLGGVAAIGRSGQIVMKKIEKSGSHRDHRSSPLLPLYDPDALLDLSRQGPIPDEQMDRAKQGIDLKQV